MIPLVPKHLILAPVYLYQGLKLKKTALRLPEAKGERSGQVTLISEDQSKQDKDILRIMLIGDSSAAGVGVSSQQQALMGQLVAQLQPMPSLSKKYYQLQWCLHATSGHTSFDALRRLYVLPKPVSAIDVMIVMVGVNDITANVSTKQWQAQLRDIIKVSKRKFGAKYIIFPSLPPMQSMPAIPSPLNKLLGHKTQVMNEKLREVCEQYEQATTLTMELDDSALNTEQFFAEDGFHPNSAAYTFLATKLAQTISELV